MNDLRPSHAEEARTLLARCRHGVLSTLEKDKDQAIPYGSLIQIAVTPQGAPLFLISNLAQHTRNLRQHSAASLLVHSPLLPGQDPLAQSRVTLVGEVLPSPETHQEEDRALMLAAHPRAARYVDFGDFHFFRMRVDKARFVGGFGRMSWVRGTAWTQAQPDPLWKSATGVIEHMNQDHADAMVLYCRAFANKPEITEALMVGVDQHGMDLQARAAEGDWNAVRINYPDPVQGSGALRRILVKMVQQARQELGLPAPGKPEPKT